MTEQNTVVLVEQDLLLKLRQLTQQPGGAAHVVVTTSRTYHRLEGAVEIGNDYVAISNGHRLTVIPIREIQEIEVDLQPSE